MRGSVIVTQPTIVQKKWGYEEHIVNGDLYCGKRLVVLPNGFASSIHYHKLKTETFHVVEGEIYLEVYGQDVCDYTGDLKMNELYRLKPLDILTLPVNTPHRFYVKEKVGIFYEFSTPDFADDSYRIVESGPISWKLPANIP